MKIKVEVLLTAVVIVGLIIYFVMKPGEVSTEPGPIKDGVYEGNSRSIYESEPYYGFATVTIMNGKIAKVEFQIKDTSRNEVFDENYEQHYVGNDYYIQQCRNDWKGVQTYPQKILETGNIKEVDAITGATWSYNIFKDSVLQALEKAK